MRFDFTHFSAVTPEELALVEHIVNQKIFEALDVTVQNMPLAEAKKMGAMALFGESMARSCAWLTSTAGPPSSAAAPM